MTTQEVSAMLSAVGLPTAYYRFLDTPRNPAPAPPFLCFFYPRSVDFYADDKNYQSVSELSVELYTDVKDFALEAAVEAQFLARDLAWYKEETYLDDQRMHMTAWDLEVVLTNVEGDQTNG